MIEYVCIRRCFHGRSGEIGGARPARKTYEIGESYWAKENEEVPRHFVKKQDAPSPPDPAEEAASKQIIKGIKAPIDPEKVEALKASRKAK